MSFYQACLALAFLASVTSACSSGRLNDARKSSEDSNAPETASIDGKATEKSELLQAREQMSKMSDKIQDLETRLSALNDKINLENGVKPSPTADESLPTQAIVTPAAHAKVVPLPKAKAGAGMFVQNEAVDRFREAKILLDSKRYSDAILEFSSFIKNYPDHALASGAQYFMGMGYALEGEYRLAEEELGRGLMTYPHSNYVPDTLAALAEVSEKLNKPARVTYYKQKLLSSFPNSPQAKEMSFEVQGGKKTSKAPQEVSPTAKAVADESEHPQHLEATKEKNPYDQPKSANRAAPKLNSAPVSKGAKPLTREASNELLPDPNEPKLVDSPDNVSAPELPKAPQPPSALSTVLQAEESSGE